MHYQSAICGKIHISSIKFQEKLQKNPYSPKMYGKIRFALQFYSNCVTKLLNFYDITKTQNTHKTAKLTIYEFFLVSSDRGQVLK